MLTYLITLFLAADLVVTLVHGYHPVRQSHIIIKYDRKISERAALVTSNEEKPLVKTEKKLPIGSTPEFAIAGDSTNENFSQKSVVALHFSLLLYNTIESIWKLNIASFNDIAGLSALIAFSVVLGDFSTGVFHWSVDNYGSIKTPIVGSVCAAFQGHHDTPWTITFRSFVNNLNKVAYGTVPAFMLLTFSDIGPSERLFFALFINWWLLSQEFHKWAHFKGMHDNKLIKFLQENSIVLSRREHGKHHTKPFNTNYCILTGVCNKFLDDSNFFRHLEVSVYRITGNKPNCWKIDTTLDPTIIPENN